MERYELIEGKSAKFWEVQADGATLTVRFGRIGTHGQTQTKTFADAAAALKERDKLIKEKTSKGYAETAVAQGAALTPKAAPHAVDTAASDDSETIKNIANSSISTRGEHAKDSKSSAIRTPEDLSWPQGGFQGLPKELSHAQLPVVRGLHVPPYEPGISLDLPPKISVSSYQGSNPNLEIMAKALGRPWVYWGEAGAAAHLTRDELTQGDRDFWLEACAQCITDWYGMRDSVPWITHAGVQLRGVAFMVDVLFTLHQAGRDWDGFDEAFEVLRHAIAAAPDAAYGDAFATAASWRGTSSPALAVAAYLFPHHQPWVDAALADPEAGTSPWLQNCVMSVEQMLAYSRRARGYRWSSLRLHIELHGAAAMGVMSDMLGQLTDKYQVESALVWIGTLHCPAQIDTLVRHMEATKETRAALDKLAEQYPAATLYTAIGHTLRTRSRMAQGWTLRLATRHPDALAQAMAVLAPADAAAWQQVMDKLVMAEAPASALPPLLQSPPWLQKIKPQALPELKVDQLASPAKLDWAEATRQQCLKLQYGDWMLTHLDKVIRDQKGHALFEKYANDPVMLRDLSALSFFDFKPDAWHSILTGRASRMEDRIEGTDCYPRYCYLTVISPPLRLNLWNHLPGDFWSSYDAASNVHWMLAEHGLAAMPGFFAYVRRQPEEGLAMALDMDAPELASLALNALRNLKKTKPHAQRWIQKHPRTTAIVALQEAFSTDKTARDNGAFGLRWLLRQGHEALIDEVAAEYGGSACPEMPAALAALKSADPLNVLPARMPKLPPFFAPATFARPQLKTGGALPLSAAEHIGPMLAISKLDAPYPGLDIVRDACTPESLAEFAWDLFEAWISAGAPSKENWAFNALGFLGNDETVRRLVPKIREWPGEGAHARAVTGLDLLATIGTDLALMNLNAIANKSKFKPLQARAKEKITAIAEARDLTADELADRLVPDLGLDEASALTLDFGPRQFTVAFDETLKPFVKDASGARLKDLPKPIKSDDADKAGAATERYKQLKKDAKAIASMQVTRLELAMVAQRRWSADDFKLFFLQHPVMRFLAQRLVWGVYVDGAFSQGFRVAEDLTLADAHDDTFTLPDGASVGLAHVLEMPADAQTAFGQALADYEILQPFRQLGRETYALTADELKAGTITRFADKPVASGAVMGLANRGWARGYAESGHVGYFYKPLDGLLAVAELDPGMVIGDVSSEPQQRIKALTLYRSENDVWSPAAALPLSQLGAIAASELLRDVGLLAPD